MRNTKDLIYSMLREETAKGLSPSDSIFNCIGKFKDMQENFRKDGDELGVVQSQKFIDACQMALGAI